MQSIRHLSFLLTGALSLLIAGMAGCGGTDTDLPEVVDFNYHVRPILVQKCYLCHGPDSGSRKANLRLDTYEGATAITKEGLKAIDPGHAEKSLVLFRINHKDPDIVMPTPESNLTLSEREIRLLEKWIEQGAEWKPHWSFLPPKKTDLSNVKEHPVDHFIGQKLREAGLDAAETADPQTLIRRVAYVLTGLPPTQADISAFEKDASPDAYAKMVDRYLASPRFGERWARHWMDVIRYAETRGHEFDYTISGAWRYRDYLIRAFNQDLPYNRFVTEQLAGDLLPDPRLDASGKINETLIATLFHTLPEGTHSPVDIKKDEADRIDNMIDVTSKAFQALTLSCARCHDHKFDPIPAKDYYSLYGVMEGTRFTPVPAQEPAQRASAERMRRWNDSVRSLAFSYMQERAGQTATYVVRKTEAPPATDPRGTVLADFSGADLQGWKSDGLSFTNSTTLGDPVVDEQGRLLGWKDGVASSRRLGTNLSGALRSPDFIIDKDFIGVFAAGQKASIRIIIDNFQLISFPIYGDLDQKVNTDKPVRFTFPVAAWKGHKAYLEVLPGSYQTHVYRQDKDAWVEVQYAIAFDKNWFEPSPASSAGSWGAALAALRSGGGTRADVRLLRGARSGTATIRGLQELVKQQQQEQADRTDSLQFISGITDGFSKNSPVFNRGNHTDLSQQVVKRRFLPAIPVSRSNLDVPGSGRLDLARAITDPKNPLTGRIMVNRIWHHVFGRGLVETVDNFGMQGKTPSHPELLDQLALEFVEDGYSVKRMIRTLLLSETFKRSSAPSGEATKKDPSNVWLSHYPVRRLEAEAIRDALLYVSGSLDTTLYGLPVPQHITRFMNGRGKPGISGPLDGNGRRSIYLEVRRNFLDPFMMAFDRPMPVSTYGRRTVTNVPSQSLILLNDPFITLMAERTQALLEKQSLKDDEQRIQWIYQRCFARKADRTEVREAQAFMEKLRSTYTKGGKSVTEKVIWKDYLHTVFNLKSFIFIT